MNRAYLRKILAGTFLLAAVLACASPLAAKPTPTPAPLPEALMQETYNAMIAGTAAAAQTETATHAPPTPTPTNTPTPSRTPTVTFTFTPTFYFSLYTATLAAPIYETMLAETATAVAMEESGMVNIGGGYYITPIPTEKQTWGNQWRCSVKYSPNLTVKPGQKFYAGWTVMNAGWNSWYANTIDFLYKGGLRGGEQNRYDIPGTVRYGQTLNIGTNFIAPKREGVYNSRYVLLVDATKYTLICNLKMTVTVVK